MLYWDGIIKKAFANISASDLNLIDEWIREQVAVIKLKIAHGLVPSWIQINLNNTVIFIIVIGMKRRTKKSALINTIITL